MYFSYTGSLFHTIQINRDNLLTYMVELYLDHTLQMLTNTNSITVKNDTLAECVQS